MAALNSSRARSKSRPAQVDHTAVVVGIGKIRPQLQALFVVGKRMLIVALVAVGDAAGIEVADIVRIGVKRGAERGDRPIVVALLDQAIAAIPEGRAPGLAGDLVVGNDGSRRRPAGRLVPPARRGRCRYRPRPARGRRRTAWRRSGKGRVTFAKRSGTCILVAAGEPWFIVGRDAGSGQARPNIARSAPSKSLGKRGFIHELVWMTL